MVGGSLIVVGLIFAACLYGMRSIKDPRKWLVIFSFVTTALLGAWGQVIWWNEYLMHMPWTSEKESKLALEAIGDVDLLAVLTESRYRPPAPPGTYATDDPLVTLDLPLDTEPAAEVPADLSINEEQDVINAEFDNDRLRLEKVLGKPERCAGGSMRWWRGAIVARLLGNDDSCRIQSVEVRSVSHRFAPRPPRFQGSLAGVRLGDRVELAESAKTRLEKQNVSWRLGWSAQDGKIVELRLFDPSIETIVTYY